MVRFFMNQTLHSMKLNHLNQPGWKDVLNFVNMNWYMMYVNCNQVKMSVMKFQSI